MKFYLIQIIIFDGVKLISNLIKDNELSFNWKYDCLRNRLL